MIKFGFKDSSGRGGLDERGAWKNQVLKLLDKTRPYACVQMCIGVTFASSLPRRFNNLPRKMYQMCRSACVFRPSHPVPGSSRARPVYTLRIPS